MASLARQSRRAKSTAISSRRKSKRIGLMSGGAIHRLENDHKQLRFEILEDRRLLSVNLEPDQLLALVLAHWF